MDTGNVTWVLVSAALVLFMTPGLAFFYGGMVRSRNVLNMLMMNFWCVLVVPVLWAVVGFSLALSGSGRFIGNFDNAFLRGLDFSTADPAVMIFLATFAAITPALISGAVADRMKFAAWAIFVPIWSLVVYCPVVFWIYGENGWLLTRGSLDFAGGTAIHVNAGIAALAAVLVLGKRKGWPRELAPPPLHAVGHDRYGNPVVRMVRIQRRIGPGRRWRRHPGLHQHHAGRRRRRTGLGAGGTGPRWPLHQSGCCLGHRGRTGGRHPRCGGS